MAPVIRAAVPHDMDAMWAFDRLAKSGTDRHAQISGWVISGECIVADDDGKAVGYMISNRRFYRQPFIELLVVADTHRRQGIGTALVRHAIERAGNEKLWTSTNQSNLPMQVLLAKLGFVESGKVENLDFGDPELIYLRCPTSLGRT